MSVPLDEARKMAIRTGKELSRRARRLLAEEVIRGLSFSHYVVDPAFDMPLTQPIFDFVRFRRGRADQIRWPRHGISLGGVDVMRKLAQLVDDILERGIRGSFVEAGAWKGANGILVRKLFDAASDVADQMRKVYSLDTFAWFPNKTNSTYYADRGIVEGFYASGRWHPNFYADLRKVKQIHTQFGINLQYGGLKLLDGDLEQLAPELAISLQSDAEKIALLVVDTNHYKGTWETLKALYAHVALGGYVLLGDYGSPPSRRAADDFRGCMGIESELVFFLPHGSPHGRHGKAYWKKTEELPPSKRLNARCEAMPSLTVGFGASQDVSFVVAHETKLGEDAWEAHERHTVFVPEFQHYGGLNDRFVFGSAAAVAMLISAREEQSRLGETFAEQAMCSAVLEHNLSAAA
ncbi:bacteriocin o-metyltransferase [Chrysochromulina tobinii]|uniref:Bacteriocin o-metyltransferase n=1 Tax=Chrysochromulina tobinii TaxID=1460289 RepID=A0A0M0JV19_9EUKA|nr:bacteriocin o-metyltransferase [Chrysochromulina tobinii]|eukprot:KOO29968.1 bacteriocin o-metyltransferase [Chrysochromulina sp. CCMP291]